MKVKLLEDNSLYGLKEGEIVNIPDEIARGLISRGIAMKAVDNEALSALKEAVLRDEPKE